MSEVLSIASREGYKSNLTDSFEHLHLQGIIWTPIKSLGSEWVHTNGLNTKVRCLGHSRDKSSQIFHWTGYSN